MVRFLHTADWQLGMKGRNVGAVTETIRQRRIETVRNLLLTASQESVDFVLIAGDIFENNAVDREVVEQVLNVFEEASRMPIFILPGNHDPLGPDSIYLQRIWNPPSHVRVLTEREPIQLKEFDTILYPCPLQQKRSRSDPTSWIPRQDLKQVRVGVAHGTLDIGLAEDLNFPIDPRRTEESNLDYLALGDWHSLFLHRDSSGVPRTVYAGTPEATSFDEKDPGHAVIVEINKRKDVGVTVINCGQLKWEVWKEHIESEGDVDSLIKKIRNLKNASKLLLTLELEGVADVEAYSMAQEIEVRLKEHLLYLGVDSSRLYLKPSISSMIGIVPEGNFRKVAEGLVALLGKEPELSRIVDAAPEELRERINEIREAGKEDVEPAVIQKALSLLYQFCKEVAEWS